MSKWTQKLSSYLEHMFFEQQQSGDFSCTRDEQFASCLFCEFNLFLVPSLSHASFFLNGSQKCDDGL